MVQIGTLSGQTVRMQSLYDFSYNYTYVISLWLLEMLMSVPGTCRLSMFDVLPLRTTVSRYILPTKFIVGRRCDEYIKELSFGESHTLLLGDVVIINYFSTSDTFEAIGQYRGLAGINPGASKGHLFIMLECFDANVLIELQKLRSM